LPCYCRLRHFALAFAGHFFAIGFNGHIDVPGKFADVGTIIA
jgi:hypothetical protein